MREVIFRVADEATYFLDRLLYRTFTSRQQNPIKILVNGSPKTGTTWMLKMITSIPGYRDAGNFHGDIQKYRFLMPGNVAHGHNRYTPELAQILNTNMIRVVLTIRDPRDQLVSRTFHIMRETTHIWNQRFKEMTIEEALTACIEGRQDLPGTRSMIEISQSWINGNIDVICVKYEDLLRDTSEQFHLVLQYLGIDISNSLVKDIVKRNQFKRLTAGRKFWQTGRTPGSSDPESHFRKGIKGDWKNYFQPEHVKKFKEVAGDKLIELGYEKNLNWNIS